MQAGARLLGVALCALSLVGMLGAPASAASAREVSVDALWYGMRADGPTGGASTVIVGVEPNPRGSLRVGFYEDVAGGSGPTWRASGWMASVLAYLTLGVDLSQYRISFDVAGQIDGPSAGGLLTTALLAALLGDTVRPDATMTGIINPDGTIGPVGGIPHKIDGAAARGKKLVLVPYGQRYDVDIKLKRPVDLVERGRAHGVEVREVRHLAEVYATLTGRPLPLAKPAGVSQPEVSPAVQAKLRDRVQGLFGRCQALAAKIKAAGQLDEALQGMASQAGRSLNSADQAFGQGLFAVAYDRLVTAAVLAESVVLGIEVSRAYREGGDGGARRYLESLRKPANSKLDALIKRLDQTSAQTLADGAALAEGYGMATEAAGSLLLSRMREGEMNVLLKQAAEQNRQGPASAAPAGGAPIGRQFGTETADASNGVVVRSVGRGTPAERAGVRPGDVMLQLNGVAVPNAATFQQWMDNAPAGTHLNVLVGRDGRTMVLTAVAEAAPAAPAAPALSAKAAEQIGQKLYEAGFFLRVADLLLDLAEDRVAVGFGLGGAPAPPAAALQKSAQLFRTSADAVMNYLDGVVLQGRATEAGASLDIFRWVFMAQDLEYALAYSTYVALNQLSLSASPYAKLGASMMLYSTASSLVAKYYSLGAELGEGGTIKSVKEKPLISMLDFALQNTRESIALAKQNGVDAVFATLYYEAAQSLREGAVEEKLTALAYLWQATAQARLLASLTGGLRATPAATRGTPSSPARPAVR
jgi:hypothetical protein